MLSCCHVDMMSCCHDDMSMGPIDGGRRGENRWLEKLLLPSTHPPRKNGSVVGYYAQV